MYQNICLKNKRNLVVEAQEKNYFFSLGLRVFNYKNNKGGLGYIVEVPSSSPILSALSVFIQLRNKHLYTLGVFTERFLLPALTKTWLSTKTVSLTCISHQLKLLDL